MAVKNWEINRRIGGKNSVLEIKVNKDVGGEMEKSEAGDRYLCSGEYNQKGILQKLDPGDSQEVRQASVR